MLSRIVLAVVVGIIVTLASALVGSLFIAMGISWVVVIGNFLDGYAALFGILAALWYFFARS